MKISNTQRPAPYTTFALTPKTPWANPKATTTTFMPAIAQALGCNTSRGPQHLSASGTIGGAGHFSSTHKKPDIIRCSGPDEVTGPAITKNTDSIILSDDVAIIRSLENLPNGVPTKYVIMRLQDGNLEARIFRNPGKEFYHENIVTTQGPSPRNLNDPVLVAGWIQRIDGELGTEIKIDHFSTTYPKQNSSLEEGIQYLAKFFDLDPSHFHKFKSIRYEVPLD